MFVGFLHWIFLLHSQQSPHPYPLGYLGATGSRYGPVFVLFFDNSVPPPSPYLISHFTTVFDVEDNATEIPSSRITQLRPDYQWLQLTTEDISSIQNHRQP